MPSPPGPPVALRSFALRSFVVVAVVFAGLLAACTSTPAQDDLVDALLRAGLSEAEATCAASALYDNLDDDTIGAIAERGPSAVIDDSGDPDEPIDVARREIAACRNVGATTTVPAEPSDSTDTVPTETSAPTNATTTPGGR